MEVSFLNKKTKKKSLTLTLRILSLYSLLLSNFKTKQNKNCVLTAIKIYLNQQQIIKKLC